jgi:L-lysine exporter family protein LysE/ArgO
MPTDYFAGFLAGAALIIAIGAQNAFVLRQGILRQHVLPIVMVCVSADALLIAAGVAGLGALIQSAPVFLHVARYGGAAFLVAYGVAAGLRATHSEQLVVEAGAGVTLGTAVTMCLAFTFLNPHVYLDTVILLGALASQRGPDQQWWFWGGASSASCLWFFLLGYGSRFLAPLFRKPIAWRLLDALVALIMFGLAIFLVIG